MFSFFFWWRESEATQNIRCPYVTICDMLDMRINTEDRNLDRTESCMLKTETEYVWLTLEYKSH